jgi:hypothetical protein
MNFRIVAASLLCSLLFPAFWGSAAAAGDAANPEDPANPYFVIAERNVFHLVPIPPPPEPEKPKEDLPVIQISGFVKIGKSTKALFTSAPKDKKEGPTYYSLAEGETQGFLELVRIHPDKGEVEIVNSGVKMTLSLKEDSPKNTITSAPSPGIRPQDGFHRGPRMPGMPGFPPMGGPGGPARVNLPGGRPNYPMRPLRGQ